MKILGIDPGAVSAAWGVIDLDCPFPEEAVNVGDVPVAGGNVNASAFKRIVEAIEPDFVVIEEVASRPGQGVRSTFTFGRGLGRIEGVIAGMGLPYMQVKPQTWKFHFRLSADKERSRAIAIQLYPTLEGLTRKKDHGRAEALLIARWYAETNKPILV